MKSNLDVFQRLFNMKAKYVVLSDHSRLPNSEDLKNVVLLAEDENSLGYILEAKKIKGDSQNKWSLTVGESETTISIIQKGKGYFPEQFESRILNDAVLLRGCNAKIPDAASLPLIVLYRNLYITKALEAVLKPHELQALKNFSNSRVGIPPKIHRDIKIR